MRKINFEKSAACFYINGGFISYGGGVWKPDRNTLTLYCAGEVVGVCEFDLTSYINKYTHSDEKAVLRGRDHVPKYDGEKFLRCCGNFQEYESAHVIFRIVVKQKGAQGTEPPRTPRPKSARNLSARVTPRLLNQKKSSGSSKFSFGSNTGHTSMPSLNLDKWETDSIVELSDEAKSDSVIENWVSCFSQAKFCAFWCSVTH